MNGMCSPARIVGGVEFFTFLADWHKKTHAIVGEKCTVKIREKRQPPSGSERISDGNNFCDESVFSDL
jgi:hypothetical protein